MRPAHHSEDDLLALGRRSELSDADRRRLRDLLASSPEARLLYEAGRAIDREAPVEAGDDERIAQIALRVSKRMRAARGGEPRRRWMMQACFAAALVATGAVGAIELRKPRTSEEGVAPSKSAPPAPSGAPAAPRRATEAAVPAGTVTAVTGMGSARSESTATPIVPQPEARVAPPRATAPRPAREPVTDSTRQIEGERPVPAGDVTASGLFAAANRARVAGDTQGAIELSRELEARYPTSNEAVTTELSLGLLYLQEHQPGLALDEFRRYRAGGPRATMPEAMWGESQALHQLGRVAEERAILEELTGGWPECAYAVAAKKRLASLP